MNILNKCGEFFDTQSIILHTLNLMRCPERLVLLPSPSKVAEQIPKWWRNNRASPRCSHSPSLFALPFDDHRRARYSTVANEKYSIYSIIYSYFTWFWETDIVVYFALCFTASLSLVQSLHDFFLNIISNYSRGIFLIFQYYVSIFIILFNDSSMTFILMKVDNILYILYIKIQIFFI